MLQAFSLRFKGLQSRTANPRNISATSRAGDQMAIDDPNTWAQAASAVKATFDSVRTAIGLVREARTLGGGNEQQQKAIDTALTTASSNAAIAEAQVAAALGYQMCKCEFPPTAMLTVGYFDRNLEDVGSMGDPVFECPKCGFTNAGPFVFTRLAPKKPK
jgi:hypothetical protein